MSDATHLGESWTDKLADAVAALDVLIGTGEVPRAIRDRAKAARACVATAETCDLIIDRRRHTVQIGDQRVCLGARWTLRSLFYAFVDHRDHHLTRDEIAERLWAVTYHPLRHDSSIKSNIRRLRMLLVETGAEIECAPEGYKLVLPPRCTTVAG